MRYEMKQKLFAWGDDFVIKDDDGNDRYFVDGKAFSLTGHQLSFQDMSGAELVFIAQKLFAWGRTYDIFRGGELVATVKKEMFTFFHCQFTVDVPGPDDLTADGSFTDHEYTLARGDRTVATVSKQWFALGDTYGVDIAEGEDPVLILASTVVIDMACHPTGKH